MTVSITAKFVMSIPSAGIFRIQAEIINAINIPMDVFVFRSEVDVFSNVATIYDLETWSTSIDTDLECYRGRIASVDYPSIAAATSFISITKHRLNHLVTSFSAIEGIFPGSETITYTV